MRRNSYWHAPTHPYTPIKLVGFDTVIASGYPKFEKRAGLTLLFSWNELKLVISEEAPIEREEVISGFLKEI